MTEPTAAAATPFSLRPLLFETFACTMAMMSFVALAGPIGRVLGLAPWQVGTAMTVAGIAWMLLARIWGAASDRRGRRPVILTGLAGFALCYAALCAFIAAALDLGMAPSLAFAGLVLWRGLAGVFYAAVPATGAALIADHVPPDRRAGALATLGAASGAGMVIGPAAAGLLAPHGLALSLTAIMPLPALAFLVLWRTLPRSPPQTRPRAAPLRLFDPRLRRPMTVAFASMFSVAVAQIIVGFYALDRLGLDPEAAARTAGIALACVGIALVLSQLVVRKLGWPPNRLIRIGGTVAALGFAGASLATTPPALWISNFVAAAGMGWVWPAFGALAANAVEPHEQGAAAGTIGSAQGLGIILGPLVGSAVYALHIAAPYGCVALLLLTVALWRPKRAAPLPLARPGPI